MSELPKEPQSRLEKQLHAIATGEGDLPKPLSRTEVYLDYIAKNGIQGSGEIVTTPNLFTWKDHPLKNKILKNENKYSVIGFDIESYKILGKQYFVDQSNGNDSNDGLSPKTAFKTLKKAYDKDDVKEIVICSKALYLNLGMNGSKITKDLTLRGHLGMSVIISNHTNVTWTNHTTYPNIYYANKANVSSVVDTFRSDGNGCTLPFTIVNSLEECNSIEDSYYIDNDTVYINYMNGNKPSYDIYVIVNDVNALEVENCTLYLDGVRIIGGIVFRNSKVYANNCKFEHSYSNCMSLLGCESILNNCVAFNSTSKDGFNYSDKGKGIEINCIGCHNGSIAESTSNGSTSHVGSKVIRVNGKYYSNFGPNVADVHDYTESWNIGCIAWNSLTLENTQNNNFNAQEGSPVMFLEGCYAFGSYDSVMLKNNANIYIKNSSIERYRVYTNSTGYIYEY